MAPDLLRRLCRDKWPREKVFEELGAPSGAGLSKTRGQITVARYYVGRGSILCGNVYGQILLIRFDDSGKFESSQLVPE